MRMRRVVDTVVGWLNACCDIQMSCINVHLASDEVETVWNDFATLLGPLSKLKKPHALAVVLRPRGQPLNAKIEQQCDRLEKVLGGESAGEAKRITEYQQAMLDIRLPVSRILRTMGHSDLHEVEQQTNRFILRPWCHSEISAGILRLQGWCVTYGVVLPVWLDKVRDLIERLPVEQGEVAKILGEVLGEETDQVKFEHWMAGLTTAFDPFQHAKVLRTDSAS